MTQTGRKVLNEMESKEHLCKKIAFKFQGYHGPYWLQGFKWQREGIQGTSLQEDCFKANMTQIGSKVLNGKEKESKEHLCKKIASRLT